VWTDKTFQPLSLMHRYFGFLIGKEVWSSSYMIHIHIHIHIAHRKALGPIGSVKATAPKYGQVAANRISVLTDYLSPNPKTRDKNPRLK
jgi:hypothetical protein